MAYSLYEQLQRTAAAHGMDRIVEMERFIAEMTFACRLAEIKKTKQDWLPDVESSIRDVMRSITDNDVQGVINKIILAEQSLFMVGDAAKQYTVYCIGHGHIDMNWMWSWPETVSITHDTFRTVLKLMDEFPDFKYSQSQASVYEIIRRYNPEMFKEIGHRIREGRWEVTASQWVEGDKNLSSGESLARHLMYTREYFKRHFDLDPDDVKIDWEGDMFGHSAMLPSILNRGGVSRYYMCRSGYPVKPWIYWWVAPDGSRILTFWDGGGYNGAINAGLMKAFFDFQKNVNDYPHFMYCYGIGDHGGGPTRRDILRIRELNEWPIFPNIKMSTSDEYFSLLEESPDRWPEVRGEINFEFTGCYTTQTLIKMANRFGESYCQEAESAAVLANRLAGKAYPSDMIREAWIPILFGQFHDILPGSGISWTREYQSGLFQESSALTQMIRTQSYRDIASRVDTSFAGDSSSLHLTPGAESTSLGAGVGYGTMTGGLSGMSAVVDGPRPVIVFNPTDHERSEVITMQLWDTDTGQNASPMDKKRFTVTDSSGNCISVQNGKSGKYWGHSYIDISFPVTVPAFGYAAYVVEEGGAKTADAESLLKTAYPKTEPGVEPAPILENEYIRAVFDPMTGGIVSLVDKNTGIDVADPNRPIAVLEYIQERPRNMSSWLVGQTKESEYPIALNNFNVTSRGDYAASITADMAIRNSTASVTYTLKRGEKKLDIHVTVDWHEIGDKETGTPKLNMRFPTNLANAVADYEIPFGIITRNFNNGQELPTQRFVNVKDDGDSNGGLLILNNCKYGCSLTGNLLRMTLIRSSYEPDPLPEVRQHTMRFAVMPHGKAISNQALIRAGVAFNQPLQPIPADIHNGALPGVISLLDNALPDGIILSAVRQSLDDGHLIMNLLNVDAEQKDFDISINEAFGAVASAETVNLMEQSQKAINVSNNRITVSIAAHSFASIKVLLNNRP